MIALASVAGRVRRQDMLQLLALFLATLFFVLAVRWPSGTGSNETWFTLAPARVALLSILAMGFGAAEAHESLTERRATAAALLLFVVASAPFDAATYAASFPSAPLWWSEGMPFLEVPAYFVLGLGLGRLAARLRLDTFLAVLVPAVLLALTWADVRLGLDVFDPLTVAVHVSWRHAAVMGLLALVGGVLHLRPGPAAAPEARPEGGGAR